MRRTLTRLLVSPIGYVLLVLATIPLVGIRLFGFLFFLDSNSGWVAAPALALVILVTVSAGATRPRLSLIGVAIALYGMSVIFHGWYDLKWRLANDGSGTFDVCELVLVVLLLHRSLLLRSQTSCSTTPTNVGGK